MSDENRPDNPPAEPSQAPQREETAPGYRVALPTFEGPLDLLLHLIEQHELDIRDIPIAFIAQKYVEYITLMEEVNIDIASEYLVMAATLAHIKSKMLLPVAPADQEDAEEAELDPRAELVRRLLEYQKYKQAAEQLGGASVLGRDVFLRGMPAPNVEGPAPLAGLSLFKLLDAFQSVLSRAKQTIDHQIDLERFSITDRINQLVDLLREKQRVPFVDLFPGELTRIDLIITFLALLEMTRLRMTRLEQAGPLEPIFVELALVDEPIAAEELGAAVEHQGAPRAAGSFAAPPDDWEEEEPSGSEEDDDAPFCDPDGGEAFDDEASEPDDGEPFAPEPDLERDSEDSDPNDR